MRDHLERMECVCDAWAEKNVWGDKFRCGCGKVASLKEANTIHPSPYALPVCRDCFDEWWEALHQLPLGP